MTRPAWSATIPAMTGARLNSFIPEFENRPWRKDGICQRPEYNAWDFADGFELANPQDKRRFISKTCGICPVAEECKAYAHSIKPVVGLYAGQYWRDGRCIKVAERVQYKEGERDEKARQKLSLTSAA